jgi:hypothetical protein
MNDHPRQGGSQPPVGQAASRNPSDVEGGVSVSARIRILDLAALEKSADGSAAALELDAVDSLAALRDVGGEVGRMLSAHYIELASLALRPGTADIVLVTVDRWAQPLSGAAQRAGGQIIGGERIPASGVELCSPTAQTTTGPRSDDARLQHVPSNRFDLLARPPCGVRTREDSVRAWIVDPVEQLEELADLMRRGLLSREEFERHKAKVIDT